jgi:hypothetical protein
MSDKLQARPKESNMQIVIEQPSTVTHVQQIVRTLHSLPPEKVAEVWGFVSFLQERYAEMEKVDMADYWSEKDLQDLTRASLAYAGNSLWDEEHSDWEAVQHCLQVSLAVVP